MRAPSHPIGELCSGGALSSEWLALYGTLFGFFWGSAMSCSCGHQGPEVLPFNLVAIALAWNAFLRVPKKLVLTRVLVDVLTVFATMLLIKNVGDVLWFGHGPLLAPMRRLTQEGAAHGFYQAGIAGCAASVVALVVQYCRAKHSPVDR